MLNTLASAHVPHAPMLGLQEAETQPGAGGAPFSAITLPRNAISRYDMVDSLSSELRLMSDCT